MAGKRRGISPRSRYRVLERSNFACFYCGVPAQLGLTELEVEHVIPVALGGTNDPWNLVAACQGCNLGKGAAMPPERVVVAARQLWASWTEETGSGVAICERCERPWALLVDEEPNRECWPCTFAWTDGLMFGKAASR